MKIYIQYLPLALRNVALTTDLLFFLTTRTTRNSNQLSFNNQFRLRDRIIYNCLIRFCNRYLHRTLTSILCTSA